MLRSSDVYINRTKEVHFVVIRFVIWTTKPTLSVSYCRNHSYARFFGNWETCLHKQFKIYWKNIPNQIKILIYTYMYMLQKIWMNHFSKTLMRLTLIYVQHIEHSSTHSNVLSISLTLSEIMPNTGFCFSGWFSITLYGYKLPSNVNCRSSIL